jgi:hypothetical protein
MEVAVFSLTDIEFTFTYPAGDPSELRLFLTAGQSTWIGEAMREIERQTRATDTPHAKPTADVVNPGDEAPTDPRPT